MRSLVLALSILAAALPCAAAPVCDPHAGDLKRAKALIDTNRFKDALPIVERVLRADAGDYHANIQKGTIVVELADLADKPVVQPNSRFNEGLQLLETTAARLPRLDQPCAKQLNYYEVLNRIGAELLNRGRTKDALVYLLKAKAAADAGLVTEPTRVKTLDNLGLAYLWLGNTDLSAKYYKDAQTKGSLVANFQLQTVQRVKELTPVAKIPKKVK